MQLLHFYYEWMCVGVFENDNIKKKKRLEENLLCQRIFPGEYSKEKQAKIDDKHSAA